VSPEGTASNHTPMKALLVVPWDEKRGGVISVVDNLARHLQTAGHEVLFFHNGGPLILKRGVTRLGYAGVRLRLTVPFGPGPRGLLGTLVFPFVFISNLLQLVWFLRSRRIDIINLHYPTDHCVYFAICRRLLPVRLVTSVHGRDAFYQERPKDRYSRAFKFVIQSSDLTILPSDAYRRKLVEAFPSMQNRAIFIHNGINPAQFSPAGDGRRATGRNRYILCVAELQEYKAIDVLLRAAAPLLTSDRSLTLVLAGDGPLRADLEALASTLGIRRQTMFLGTQGAPEIARLLHGCETMVLPSRMEPFGIALIEAMACKAPVVATKVGGIPEIVEHETSGILVEPENPEALTAGLCRVLTDQNLRKRIVANGYSRVMERFCSTHNGAAYLSAFTSLLQSMPQSPSAVRVSSHSGNARAISDTSRA
jgi:glycosyltransferase involved in cell wall biosynthesis